MAFAEDLLEQAAFLARREPTRPKQASLRRAISTAYYAIFHLLIAETVKNWKRPADRERLGRLFEHATMRKACIERRDRLREPLLRGRVPAASIAAANDLIFVAETFVKMQQDRHLADYDGSIRWTRTDAKAKIAAVAAAFDRWETVGESALAHELLLSLFLRERR